MWIYLLHWQVYPWFEDRFPLAGHRARPGRRLLGWQAGERGPRGLGAPYGGLTPRGVPDVTPPAGMRSRPVVEHSGRIPDHSWRYDARVGRIAMISLHTSPLDQPGTGTRAA